MLTPRSHADTRWPDRRCDCNLGRCLPALSVEDLIRILGFTLTEAECEVESDAFDEGGAGLRECRC